MSGLLSLKWNNHSIAFINTVSNIRKKEKFCDATIICHGRFYPVHKFVLSTCSEYFEEIFEQIDNKNPIIIIKDIDTKELESLLNYMYDGEVNVYQELLPGLIKSAEALKIRGLAVPDDEDKNDSKNTNLCSNSRGKRFRTSSPVSLNKKRSRHLRRSEEVFQSSNDKEHLVGTSDDQGILNVNEKSESASTSLEVINKQNVKPDNTNCNYTAPNEQGQFSKPQLSDVKLEPVEIGEQARNYDSQEILFTESTNLKDENYSNYENEDSLTGHQNIPQCSTWDDIEPPSDGDGLSGIDERTDDIGRLFRLRNSSRQESNIGHLKTKPSLSKFFMESTENDLTSGAMKCNLGPFQSRTSESIYQHVADKHMYRLIKCPVCPYSTRDRSNFTKHFLTHSGEKTYHCKLCPYKALLKHHYKSHMQHRHSDVISGDI